MWDQLLWVHLQCRNKMSPSFAPLTSHLSLSSCHLCSYIRYIRINNPHNVAAGHLCWVCAVGDNHDVFILQFLFRALTLALSVHCIRANIRFKNVPICSTSPSVPSSSSQCLELWSAFGLRYEMPIYKQHLAGEQQGISLYSREELWICAW